MSTTVLTLRRTVAAAFTIVLLGSLAACGDGSDDADDSSLPTAAGASSDAPDGADEDAALDPEDAMLKYARCMREHGVDMPDPEPGGGISINGDGLSPEQMETAEAECEKWMDMAMAQDEGGHELTEDEKQSFLDMAACMRERGYDFPDPEFGDDGRVTQRVEKPAEGQPGPDDPAFQQDMEECSSEAGMEPPGDGEGATNDERS